MNIIEEINQTEEIIKNTTKRNDALVQMIQSYRRVINQFGSKNFDPIQRENENDEEYITRAETSLDQLYELYDRNTKLIEVYTEIKTEYEKVINKLTKSVGYLENESNNYYEDINKIDNIINTKLQKMEEIEIQQLKVDRKSVV